MIKWIDEVLWRSDRDVADLDIMVNDERIFIRTEADKSIGGTVYSSIDEYVNALMDSDYVSFLHVTCKNDTILTSVIIKILNGLKNHPQFDGIKVSAYSNICRYIGYNKIKSISGRVCVNTHSDPEDIINHLNWWLWETHGVVPAEFPDPDRIKKIFGRLRKNDWYRNSVNILRRFANRHNMKKITIGGWGLATYRDIDIAKEFEFEVIQTRF